MENQPPASTAHMDGERSSKKGGLFNRLLGRDRKPAANGTSTKDLADFFNGPLDKSEVAHATPPVLPVLTKLDIASATRHQNISTVGSPGYGQQHQPLASPLRTSRRVTKDALVVKFVDTVPEIIGIGGGECKVPTVEISKSKKTNPPPVTTTSTSPRPADLPNIQRKPLPQEPPRNGRDVILSSRQPSGEDASEGNRSPEPREGLSVSKRDHRKSTMEVQQAQMRAAEGLAFAQAVRTASSSGHEDDMRWNQGAGWKPSPTATESPGSGMHSLEAVSSLRVPAGRALPAQRHPVPPPLQGTGMDFSPSARNAPTWSHPESPESRLKGASLTDSPTASLHSQASGAGQTPGMYRPSSRQPGREQPESATSPYSPYRAAFNLSDVGLGVEDDAIVTFVARTRHLFELFRLHSESVKPLLACQPEELARASLWWFLRGRMALEQAIRGRAADAEGQRRNEAARQQAFADLAKSYWLSEDILSEILDGKHLQATPEVQDARNVLASNLRKLTMSMKKNGFLPPEEALLPAHLDRSIWIEYPRLNQDVVGLLHGAASSGLVQNQGPVSSMELMDSLLLGDTTSVFSFGRVPADVFLMEQDAESERLYFPCLLSVIRPQKQSDMMFVITSQNGAIQLPVSGDKKLGPTWEDVRWRSEACTLDIKLPRGFLLSVQCAQKDYRLLRSMHDFTTQVLAMLYPKKDEQCVFRTTLRAFQYFDKDSQARQFPKEVVRGCELALFERIQHEKAATGPRNFHRGFRLVAITGPATKTLSGINQLFPPQKLFQFSFLRGERNEPAMSTWFDNGKQKGSMVATFQDEKERLRMHSLMAGTALRGDEEVCVDIPIQGIWFSEKLGETSLSPLKACSSLAWQKARIINDTTPRDRPSGVLAERLRIVSDFKDGTLTDRVNVAPGELKLRLVPSNLNCLMVYRQPQLDLTMAVSETPTARERDTNLTEALATMQQTPTIRTYMFSSLIELHAFETALTGFKVLYDGVAAAFCITRRRMVVPIHKKWEAGSTRLQVVQDEGVLQLLVFFEDFSHGRSMSFTLKGTDVFETLSRGGKAGLKIDDAKFPLPKVLGDQDDARAAADAAFVCLDLPELPGEHDDISILFDDEADRQKLIDCLPAPVKGSRMARIKGSRE